VPDRASACCKALPDAPTQSRRRPPTLFDAIVMLPIALHEQPRDSARHGSTTHTWHHPYHSIVRLPHRYVYSVEAVRLLLGRNLFLLLAWPSSARIGTITGQECGGSFSIVAMSRCLQLRTPPPSGPVLEGSTCGTCAVRGRITSGLGTVRCRWRQNRLNGTTPASSSPVASRFRLPHERGLR